MATNDPKKLLIDRQLEFRKTLRSNVFQNDLKRNSYPQYVARNELNIRKGVEFESFVVRRFDRRYFTLVEWRSDKIVDGVFPLMSKFPDLEFYFEYESEKSYLAVECKWRESFQDETITLKKSQLENYRHYQKATGHKTYLILGIGNSPANPNQVYIIPLKEIEQEILHEFNLEVYSRSDPGKMFYYGASSGFLK